MGVRGTSIHILYLTQSTGIFIVNDSIMKLWTFTIYPLSSCLLHTHSTRLTTRMPQSDNRFSQVQYHSRWPWTTDLLQYPPAARENHSIHVIPNKGRVVDSSTALIIPHNQTCELQLQPPISSKLHSWEAGIRLFSHAF